MIQAQAFEIRGDPMQHELYSSIDEMLAPACLSELTGTRIRTVRLRPMSDRQGVSGNQLLAIETDNDARLILKRMSWERDWVMRASNDQRCRAVTLWQSGVLDQLLPELSHAIITCAQDDDGWALLMHDVTGGCCHGTSTSTPLPMSISCAPWPANTLDCGVHPS
jgi:hypothetical protein